MPSLHKAGIPSIKEQLSQVLPVLALVMIIAIASIAGIVVIKQLSGVRFPSLTSDPAFATNSKFFIGILSNIGVMLWSSTTAICFFSAAALHSNTASSGLWRFFFWSGMLSLILTLDDSLMFHERLFPRYLNVPERLVYLTYIMSGIAYIVFYFKRILKTDYILLVLAIIFLGSSVIADQFMEFSDIEYLVEDSLKYTGILFWLAYFSRTALKALHSEE